MADLNSKLNKFKQQHEKVQQVLTDVASSKRPSKKKVAAAPPPNSGPQPQNIASLTFQNDKEKLQLINQVRRSPTMAQVKRVIDLLLETRKALLPDEINNICFVDVTNNKEVFDTLKNNVKVSYDGHRFSYKAKHLLQNKQELLVQLRKQTEGMALSELKDAYPGIVNDVQELKAGGDIRVMCNTDSQEEILYPDDPRVKIKVDDDVAKLVRSTELPTDFLVIERELQKIGIKPLTNSAAKRERVNLLNPQQATKQKKKKRNSKIQKFTNKHLPELFNIIPPDI